MTGCCLYCKFAESYWIDPAGNIRRPPKVSFGDMNIYCHHPDKGAGIECYPISFTRCSVLNVTQTSVLNAGERFSRNLIDTASTLS